MIWFLIYLQQIFLNRVKSIYSLNNNIYLHLVNNEDLLFVLTILKKFYLFQTSQLLDIICVDYPMNKARFELTYVLLSLVRNCRFFIKIGCCDVSAINSSCKLFASANWLEREVWDLFGVFFKNHPDLRRILTDYGFIGFPLRKDFPLTGYLEVRYDDVEKRVITEPIDINQEFRYFNFLLPWGSKRV